MKKKRKKIEKVKEIKRKKKMIEDDRETERQREQGRMNSE